MRKIISNHWSIILLTLVIIFAVFLFTFYLYPSLIYKQVQNTPGYSIDDDKLGRGTYGDMYGALNTFFSGLAFIGLIVTIAVQIYLHEKENKSKKADEDIKEKRKLIYLENLVHRSTLFTNETIKNIRDFNILIENNPNEIPKIKQVPINEINIIVNKLNQEKIFNAYISQIQTNEINEIFAFFTVILGSYNSFIYSLQESIKFDAERKINCSNHINETVDELKKVILFLEKQSQNNTDDLDFFVNQKIIINSLSINNSLDIFKFTTVFNDLWGFLINDNRCSNHIYKNLMNFTSVTLSHIPSISEANQKVANQSLELKNKLEHLLVLCESKLSPLRNFKNKTILK